MSNYFVYNNVRSDIMGLRIESKNVFSAPKYEAEFHAIPGRDGEIIIPNRRFPNVQVTYTVFLPAKSLTELSQKLTAVKAWLFTEPDRYHELRDSYDTTAFRYGVINTALDIQEQLNRIGMFTVSFSCLPFKYLLSGSEPEVFTADSFTIVNPTPFTAKPLIRLTGQARTAEFKFVHDDVEQTWTIDGMNGPLDIDSDIMLIHSNGTPMNDKVEGPGFPLLLPGSTLIKKVGGIASITITPRFITL